jgi:hypothetical protein
MLCNKNLCLLFFCWATYNNSFLPKCLRLSPVKNIYNKFQLVGPHTEVPWRFMYSIKTLRSMQYLHSIRCGPKFASPNSTLPSPYPLQRPKYQPRLQSTITRRTNNHCPEIFRGGDKWIIRQVIRKYTSAVFYFLQNATNFFIYYTTSSCADKNTRRKNGYTNTFLLNL